MNESVQLLCLNTEYRWEDKQGEEQKGRTEYRTVEEASLVIS